MANAYEIPWAPPDIGPAASLFVSALNQNRAADRSDEYLAMEREAMRANQERASHEDILKEEARKRQQAIDAWNAMPAIVRAAHRSVGMANVNPYGIKFDEEQGQTPSLRSSGINVMGGSDQYAQHAAKALLGQVPEVPPTTGIYGYDMSAPRDVVADYNPSEFAGQANSKLYGAHDMAADNDAARDASGGDANDYYNYVDKTAPEPTVETSVGPMEGGVEAAQALLGQPSQRRLFASYQGQRFEVPEQSETTGFGAKYDAIYQRALQEPGITPEEAYKFVAKMVHEDATETGRNTRLTQAITGRENAREDQQRFLEQMAAKYKLTFEQRKELQRMYDQAKANAAGVATPTDMDNLAALIRGFQGHGDIGEAATQAAEFKKPLSPKIWEPALKQVTTQATAGERAGQRRESLTATDETGNVIGNWKDSTAARTGAKQIESFSRVKMRLNELIADVAASGNRVLSPEEIQQRVSKGESVVAALRPYNELGSTDASVKMEAAIVGALGAPGHGFLMGANPSILKRLLDEAEKQHQVQLSTKLRPGGGSQLAPALGGPRRGTGGNEGAHPAQAPVGETRPGPDGRTYRKVGPNNWQPVEP